MSGSIVVGKNLTKAQSYTEITPQVAALLDGEPDALACLSNIAAALKEVFNFFWVGFYIVRGDELVLGPFQGPVACTRIARGRGVCGTAWQNKQTLIVDDVDQFPGHIACSAQSRSEIVVPLKASDGKVWAVLDVDSEKLKAFDVQDAEGLQKILDLLGSRQLAV